MKKLVLTVGAMMALFVACKDGADKPKANVVTLNLGQNSKMGWKGKAADGNFNEGKIDVAGEFKAEVYNSGILNNIISGEITVPVSSINVTNLPPDLKPMLENHLKSADFFNMVVHPNVIFKVISGVQLKNGDPDHNYLIKGEMTLLGETHPLEFPAKILFDGSEMNVKADFTFDQSIWGMDYHLEESYPANDRLVKGVDVSFDLTAN
jgi:polyisoprenoid-binding protein YceI